MKILVVGPESSGTRMLAAILGKTGHEIIHSSPAFRMFMDDGNGQPVKYFNEYDKVVLIIRNGVWNEQSMQLRGRAVKEPRAQIAEDILDVLIDFRRWGVPVIIQTYESLVYEQDKALWELCNALGIDPPIKYDQIMNGNEKFWSQSGWPGDDRDLSER